MARTVRWLLLLLPACTSTPGPKAGPGAIDMSVLPFGDIPIGDQSFALEEAEAVVERIEAEWPTTDDDSLRDPQTPEDVQKILKLDQTNLFDAAIEVLSTDQSVEARALLAQIELAWGESYTILMETLLTLGRQVDLRAMSLQQKQMLSQAQRVQLERLRELGDRIGRVVDLFQVLSLDHVSKGAQLAQKLIDDHPESYLGYRVSADHKRMVRDWEAFDVMVVKIEEIRPDSTGLVFLRGAAALQRDDDRELAQAYYREALEDDPGFVRAQAHLVMGQSDLDGMYEELQQLKKLNPNHQLVLWMEDALEIAYSE